MQMIPTMTPVNVFWVLFLILPLVGVVVFHVQLAPIAQYQASAQQRRVRVQPELQALLQQELLITPGLVQELLAGQLLHALCRFPSMAPAGQRMGLVQLVLQALAQLGVQITHGLV